MKIENLTELTKLVDMCRRKGVESLSIEGLSLKLSDYVPSKTKKTESSSALGDDAVDWDSLSPEEQLFYSSVGGPALSADSE